MMEHLKCFEPLCLRLSDIFTKSVAIMHIYLKSIHELAIESVLCVWLLHPASWSVVRIQHLSARTSWWADC